MFDGWQHLLFSMFASARVDHLRSSFTGNPGKLANWADEGLNRNLAIAARAVHSVNFEKDLLSRFAHRSIRARVQ